MKSLFLLPSDRKPEPPVFEQSGNVSHQIFERTDVSDLPFIDAQAELENLFNKNQRIKRIKREFDIQEFHDMCWEAMLPIPFCLDLCTQMVIHKRTTPSVLIGILHHHFETTIVEDDVVINTRPQAMQLCADMLESAIEHDFANYDLSRDEVTEALSLKADAINDLERYQYPLPMIVQPRPVTSNRQNGYLSPTTSDSLVVLRGEKAGKFYEKNDICLDHLDRVNKIPLTINSDVVSLIDNEWKDIDKRRSGETQEDYSKRIKAFEKYDRSSKDVISALTQMRDRFWLTHKYDRRGRVYCQGYHINYQGNPWNKAAVELANKELLSC